MTAPDFGGHDRRSQMNYALAMTDSGRNPGEPDLLDEIRALTRDLSFEQRQARLGELRAYSRPLSGRQRVEAALLEQQVATESRIMAQVSAGTIGQIADRPLTPNPSPGMPPSDHGGWSTPNADPRVQAYRTAGMNAVQAYSARKVLNAAAADRLDNVLRHGDGQGLTARYIAAVGNDHYASAFGKMLADPMQAHLRFTPDEVRAVQEIGAVQDQHRVMNAALTTGASGFPLPLTIDVSIVATGAGALNPIRDLAQVRTIGTHDLQFVTADSITAGYVAEGVEATDASPALLGPKIRSQQGRAFVQFSIEASQDWESLAPQLEALIADARNVTDATAWLTGNGTNAPFGIFGADATYSLAVAQRVLTATTATLAAGDSWLLKAGIPARFIASTTWAAAPATWDAIFQLVPQGSTTLAQQFDAAGRGGNWLGRPKVEWSPMATGSTTGTKLVVGGDWKTGYAVVDRLGLTAELIPHMLGTNRLPLGVRGLYVYWRSGAGVLGANALRYLEVK